MEKTISACGVLCSACPAYMAASKGIAHQKRTAKAWQRIYGLLRSVFGQRLSRP
jgi:hypothetical protein